MLFAILSLCVLAGCPPDDVAEPCPLQFVEPQESPAWQVPVVVSSSDEILDYGVIEYDNRERDIIVRLVLATPFGPDVIHGPVTTTVPLGDASVAAQMIAPISPPHAPILIQVWRPDIAPINQGRLVGVWVQTRDLGLVHFSAISGNGAGTTGYMQPVVDWME